MSQEKVDQMSWLVKVHLTDMFTAKEKPYEDKEHLWPN